MALRRTKLQDDIGDGHSYRSVMTYPALDQANGTRRSVVLEARMVAGGRGVAAILHIRGRRTTRRTIYAEPLSPTASSPSLSLTLAHPLAPGASSPLFLRTPPPTAPSPTANQPPPTTVTTSLSVGARHYTMDPGCRTANPDSLIANLALAPSLQTSGDGWPSGTTSPVDATLSHSLRSPGRKTPQEVA